jgi:hypothetical protein
LGLREIQVLTPILAPGVTRKAIAVPTVMEWWEQGVPLAEAPDRFAPASLAAPLEAAQPQDRDLTGGMKMLADQEPRDANGRQPLREGLEGVLGLIENFAAVGSLNYRRGRHVASIILEKKAVAVGFPNGAAEPQIIPAYLFENPPFIKWGKSEIIGNGFHFVSVKVAKLQRSEQLPEIPNKQKKKTPSKVGRRASSEVIDIIHELNKSPGFRQMRRKAQAELVIKEASEKFPERFPGGKGLRADPERNEL